MEITNTTRRTSFVVWDEDTSYTFMKPHSGWHENRIIVLTEDAYGEISSSIYNNNELIDNIPSHVYEKVKTLQLL